VSNDVNDAFCCSVDNGVGIDDYNGDDDDDDDYNGVGEGYFEGTIKVQCHEVS